MELTKKDRKYLDKLRHEVHLSGELLTLRQLLDRMEVYKERPCMVEKRKDEVITYSVKRFREDVYALGTALIARGYKGRHIGILSENSYAWVVAFFAISCGVGVVVPVDRELPDEDISRLFTKADCESMFFSRAYVKTVRAHFAADERVKEAFCFNKEFDDENIISFDSLVKEGYDLIAGGDTSFKDAVIEKDDLAAIVFTSGTTGANKGVMLTHGNFAQNAEGVLESIQTQYSSISLLPMNHVYELSCDVFTALYMNCVIYINDSIKNFMNNVEEFAPDAFAIVPLVIDTIYNTIWRTARQTGREEILKKGIKISNFLLDNFHIDVRKKMFKQISEKFGGKFPTMSCGGAPTRTEYVKCLCDLGFTIYNGYGLTESSPTVTLNIDCRSKPDCAGKPFPKARYKIHEPDEKGVGEIWIQGENVTKGYYKDEAATAASFEDGWFKTGDYGRTGEDGLLYIVGRKKNLIILDNGKNVFPEEVESFYMENIDYIRQACVFEAEKEINGAVQKIIVGAFEINTEDMPGLTLEELDKKVREDVFEVNKKLPSYKRCQDIYTSDTEFEMNTQRKVQRSKIVERYYNSLK